MLSYRRQGIFIWWAIFVQCTETQSYSWDKLADLNVPVGEFGVACFIRDEQLWVIDGDDSKDYAQVLDLSASSAEWSQEALGWSARLGPRAVVADGWTYVITHAEEEKGRLNPKLKVLPPPPDVKWLQFDLPPKIEGSYLGDFYGVFGVVRSVDGAEVPLYCGGWDQNEDNVSTCYSVHVKEEVDGMYAAAVHLHTPLPQPRTNACHGSDGYVLMAAGGLDQNVQYSDVIVHTDRIDTTPGYSTDPWQIIAGVKMGGKTYSQAGVMIEGNLVCLGGRAFNKIGESTLFSDNVEVLPLDGTTTAEQATLPDTGSQGCAVLYGDDVIWVRAQSSSYLGSTDVWKLSASILVSDLGTPPAPPALVDTPGPAQEGLVQGPTTSQALEQPSITVDNEHSEDQDGLEEVTQAEAPVDALKPMPAAQAPVPSTVAEVPRGGLVPPVAIPVPDDDYDEVPPPPPPADVDDVAQPPPQDFFDQLPPPPPAQAQDDYDEVPPPEVGGDDSAPPPPEEEYDEVPPPEEESGESSEPPPPEDDYDVVPPPEVGGGEPEPPPVEDYDVEEYDEVPPPDVDDEDVESPPPEEVEDDQYEVPPAEEVEAQEGESAEDTDDGSEDVIDDTETREDSSSPPQQQILVSFLTIVGAGIVLQFNGA